MKESNISIMGISMLVLAVVLLVFALLYMQVAIRELRMLVDAENICHAMGYDELKVVNNDYYCANITTELVPFDEAYP